MNPGQPIRTAAWRFEPTTLQLHRRGESVGLTPLEAKLLVYLAGRGGAPASHRELLREVWGYAESASSRTVYTTANRLRSKLEEDPSNPRYLLAVAGGSYQLVLDAGTEALLGRAGELEALRAWARGEGRLLTLLGLGGVGKTTLARAFLAEVEGLDGGAWFCDLTSAADAAAVQTIVARALGVPLTHGDPEAQLGTALAARGRVLLVVDNVEQVHEAVAHALGGWLGRAPALRVLATSRVPLGLREEQRLPVAPLALPEHGAVAESPAVQLFVRRARLARPGFELTEANRHDVAEAVRALDGLPLAIELGAARMVVLSPAQLRQRLARGLDLLRSDEEDRPLRHRTLEAALLDAWAALSEGARGALADLSVFAGAVPLEAAEAVLRAGESALDELQCLAETGLVRTREQADGGFLFDLLVTVRSFAAARLAESPEAERRARARHVDWYTKLATEGEDRAGTHALCCLEALPELERAVVHARWLGDGVAEARAALGAIAAIDLVGPYARGAALAAAARQAPGLPAPLAVDLLLAEGRGLQFAGDPKAAEARFSEAIHAAGAHGLALQEAVARLRLGQALHDRGRNAEAVEPLEAALAAFRALGDRSREGESMGSLGLVLHMLARPEAEGMLLDALAIHQARGERPFEATVLSALGRLYGDLGRTEPSERYLALAVKAWRELGNVRMEGAVLGNLGLTHYYRGLLTEAREALAHAVTLLQRVGDRRTAGNTRGNLGMVLVGLGELTEGLEHLRVAVEVHREVGRPTAQAIALNSIGIVLASRGELENALQVQEEALALGEGVKLTLLIANTQGNMALTLRQLGRHADSWGALDRSIALCAEGGFVRNEAFVRLFEARWAVADGMLPRAERALARAFELAAADDMGAVWPAAMALRAELAVARGEAEAAWADVEAATPRGVAGTDAYERTLFLASRAWVAARTGRPELARDALDEVARMMERMGAGPRSWLSELMRRVERALGRDS